MRVGHKKGVFMIQFTIGFLLGVVASLINTVIEYLITNKILEGGKSTNSPLIKIKYASSIIERIKPYTQGDWIDLRAAETVELKKGEFKLIPLGVAMELPSGYEANVVPRSSTMKNFGIIQANHYGVIDTSYCGDSDFWMFPAIAVRDTKIEVNDRICQFRINEIQPSLRFKEVQKLNGKSRGGFGSTGTK